MSAPRFFHAAKPLIAWTCLAACFVAQCGAQELPFVVQKPQGIKFTRSYIGATVPPIRMANSQRIYSLIRAGILYLTLQDAIALAIENNLNIEAERYSPLSADWGVLRSQAGGPLRGVPGGAPQVGAVNSGLGILGTLQSAGLGTGGGGGGGGGNSSGGANIQQVGPVVVNFDPSFTNSSTFTHATLPQANASVIGTTNLVVSQHVYSTKLTEGLASGASVTFQDYHQSIKENSPGDNFNPAVGPYLQFQFQQPLLQNAGFALNSRSIRIAQNNTRGARESFRLQLVNLVANVINSYWDLVSRTSELRARRSSVEIAEKFNSDTNKQIALGAIARVEAPRALAEVASRQQDLIQAEVAVAQQEALLKEMLVRRDDPVVDAARIVALDSIQVPELDELPPLRTMVGSAMESRPDVALAKINETNAAISAIGTANGLLPYLIAYAGAQDRGAAGVPQVVNGVPANPYFAGGYGNAYAQIFRHNFPTEYAGLRFFNLNIHNNVAQADYGIEQLQLQESALAQRRDANDIVVNVSNQMIAVRQARAKYSTAVNTRKLQEQLLKAEQEKFTYGTTKISNLIIDQRALVTAQISEVSAAAAYAHAQASLDQVLGQTLEKNHVTLEEGLAGRVNSEPKGQQ